MDFLNPYTVAEIPILKLLKSKMDISSPVFCVVEFKYPLDKMAKIKKNPSQFAF